MMLVVGRIGAVVVHRARSRCRADVECASAAGMKPFVVFSPFRVLDQTEVVEDRVCDELRVEPQDLESIRLELSNDLAGGSEEREMMVLDQFFFLKTRSQVIRKVD